MKSFFRPIGSDVFCQGLSGHINLEQFLFFTPMTWSITEATAVGRWNQHVRCGVGKLLISPSMRGYLWGGRVVWPSFIFRPEQACPPFI